MYNVHMIIIHASYKSIVDTLCLVASCSAIQTNSDRPDYSYELMCIKSQYIRGKVNKVLRGSKALTRLFSAQCEIDTPGCYDSNNQDNKLVILIITLKYCAKTIIENTHEYYFNDIKKLT